MKVTSEQPDILARCRNAGHRKVKKPPKAPQTGTAGHALARPARNKPAAQTLKVYSSRTERISPAANTRSNALSCAPSTDSGSHALAVNAFARNCRRRSLTIQCIGLTNKKCCKSPKRHGKVSNHATTQVTLQLTPNGGSNTPTKGGPYPDKPTVRNKQPSTRMCNPETHTQVQNETL